MHFERHIKHKGKATMANGGFTHTRSQQRTHWFTKGPQMSGLNQENAFVPPCHQL
ncbi:MAG: hypothetical protein ACPHOK_02175 [Akkermansiaceae bacterium]